MWKTRTIQNSPLLICEFCTLYPWGRSGAPDYQTKRDNATKKYWKGGMCTWSALVPRTRAVLSWAPLPYPFILRPDGSGTCLVVAGLSAYDSSAESIVMSRSATYSSLVRGLSA